MGKTALTIFLMSLFCTGVCGRDSDTLKVFVLGDVMMHESQFGYPLDTYFSDIKDEMEDSGLCIANMEFSLGGIPYSGYPSFSAPDGIAEYMVSCGTDIFLMANNHILDRGAKGLDRTLDVYGRLRDSTGVTYTGIGREPLIVDKGGFRLGIINFTYGTNSGTDGRVNRMDRESVAGMIGQAKAAGADFILAFPHWGTEYSLRHDRTQQDWAEWLVGQGADVIIGSHPHVVQDTSHIRGIPVIYSVGNAVSNMSATNTRLELAVTLRFVRDERGARMLEPQLDFLWCTLPGRLKDGYSTISIKKWAGRRSDWLIPSDYDNMSSTLERVKRETGISY